MLPLQKTKYIIDGLAGIYNSWPIWQTGSLAGRQFGRQAVWQVGGLAAKLKDKLVKTFLIHFMFY